MTMSSRRVILAAVTAVVLTGCGTEPEPAASAARFVTTPVLAAPQDRLAGEKDQVRTVREAAARAARVEALRIAAEHEAAENARIAAEQAAQAAAAQAAAAQAAAAERAVAEHAASRASRAKAPAAAAAPSPGRAAAAPPRAAAAPAPPRAAAPAPVSGGAGESAYEAEILSLTNRERSKAGLSPLQRSSCAAGRAGTWSQRMADTGTMSHQPLGPVLDACGARGAAENVAFGNISAAQMVSNWMNSAGHRANILSPALTHLGVGAVQRSDGRWYGTQVFLTL
jgi:uncharacterized protein YkwD